MPLAQGRLLALTALLVVPGVAAVVSDDVAVAAPRRFIKTDSAGQSGHNGSADNARISAAADPFAFRRYGHIRTLETVVFTATITDGDTGPGDSDTNGLFLALDGFNTGLALNGFRNNRTDTVTIKGTPQFAGAIVRALKEDGRLEASIVNQANPGNLVTIPSTSQTTLTIKGTERRPGT